MAAGQWSADNCLRRVVWGGVLGATTALLLTAGNLLFAAYGWAPTTDRFTRSDPTCGAVRPLLFDPTGTRPIVGGP